MTGDQSAPLVSVIVPAYNAEQFIERTLHSVLSQTYRNIEVLVVDDGSLDQTRQLVHALAKKDKRIRLWSQHNKGVAAARNLAINHARGVYIAPLDADDIWFPEKLERQVACMEQGGPEMGLVYSWWIMIDEADLPLQASARWDVEGSVFEALLYINFIGNASVPMMRRTCIQQVGGYSTRLKEKGGQGCEDWDLALRLAARYQVGVAYGYLVGYRRVRHSMTMNLDSMGRSHQLIVEQLRHCYPHISPFLYRWSGSIFYTYLGRLGYRDKNYQAAKHWIVQALTVDRLLFLSLPFLKLLVKSLLQIPGWRKERRGSGQVVPQNQMASAPHALDRLTANHGTCPRSWTWKSVHPYDWVSWYRWQKVLAKCQALGSQTEVSLESRLMVTYVPTPQMQDVE